MTAVGTWPLLVPLPAPMALTPIGTLDCPGAWIAAAFAAAVDPAPAVAPVLVVVVLPAPVAAAPVVPALLLTFCAIPSVLASAKPAVIKVVRRPILKPLLNCLGTLITTM